MGEAPRYLDHDGDRSGRRRLQRRFRQSSRASRRKHSEDIDSSVTSTRYRSSSTGILSLSNCRKDLCSTTRFKRRIPDEELQLRHEAGPRRYPRRSDVVVEVSSALLDRQPLYVWLKRTFRCSEHHQLNLVVSTRHHMPATILAPGDCGSSAVAKASICCTSNYGRSQEKVNAKDGHHHFARDTGEVALEWKAC